ncbi:hypothetical protein PHYSODRAFT_294452 [Phytophthora sojae]|uniref:Restriction endonuclease domain-containing protein n=1 Tax=Phytophthora sojae (strain P6497) TaxID=1094619 RepID=G4YJ32_PHYSP|nr:hypothetical protein PHYSODRAFT_294452 [Phytophthora sojae]EGZ29172.1 hypothetical protein PHYSODRAFT_294452 [Phytophthora sojae]|eukprot:XP_009516447.1 hypothetical protein PHYSODRAFT_294452 [Phytophthora sojae]
MGDADIEHLNRVREELYQRDEADERGDDVKACRPVVLFEEICRDDFRAWIEDHQDDDDFRYWDYEPLTVETGRAVLYYFPTAVQTLAVSEIINEIRSEVVRIGDDEELSETMLTSPSPTLRFGNRLQNADAALEPRHALRRDLPNVVVHAAYTESWSHLEKKLQSYMIPATAVQVAIGIRIFGEERRVMIFQRIDENTFYEDEFDLTRKEPGYFSIPVETLYRGGAIPTSLAGHESEEVKVDLAWLRDVIDEFDGRA